MSFLHLAITRELQSPFLLFSSALLTLFLDANTHTPSTSHDTHFPLLNFYLVTSLTPPHAQSYLSLECWAWVYELECLPWHTTVCVLPRWCPSHSWPECQHPARPSHARSLCAGRHYTCEWIRWWGSLRVPNNHVFEILYAMILWALLLGEQLELISLNLSSTVVKI